MKRFYSLLLIVFFSNIVLATETQRLRVHGSNTVGASLMPELVKSWLISKKFKIISDKITAKEERLIIAGKAKQRLEIEIHAHGSSTSFKDFASGKTDVGMSSRPIKSKELKKLTLLGDLKSENSEYVIALDGLPIIVHPSNPLNKISVEMVHKIFTGQITQWKQLGVKGGQIKLYARDKHSGTYDTFKSLVLKKKKLAKNAKRFESNAMLSDKVANESDGIGFVGMAYISNSKVLAISDEDTTALKPAAFTVATEDYVLARRLFLYVPEKDVHPLAKELVDYAVTSAVDKIVTQVGFVSQKISGHKIIVSDHAPEEYRQLTKGAQRLSLNVRFRKGSIELDNKAIHDLERLVAYMAKPENKKRHIMLFGFADKREVMPFASLTFSVGRADSIADYLLKQHVASFKVRGYGQQLPVATNSTEIGRNKNRRVEIWMM